MPGMGDAVRVLSFIALHFQLKSNSIKRKKITIIFSKEKPKKRKPYQSRKAGRDVKAFAILF